MKFHNFTTMFSMFRNSGQNDREFYAEALDACNRNIDGDLSGEYQRMEGMTRGRMKAARARAHIEDAWFQLGRPYYKVWPAVVNPLCKLHLDVSFFDITSGMTSSVLAARFSEGNEVASCDLRLRSLIVCYKKPSSDDPYSGVLWVLPCIYDNSSNTELDAGGVMLRGFEPTIQGELDAMGNAPGGRDGYDSICRAATKIAMTVLLLANDPSIIKPDVLAADREAYDRTGDPKYIERAKKKGIVGWRIGEEYETCPHFRRPHFALRHTGKGKTIPKIVPVKGAVVHRSKLTQVPTGYITPDGIEVEPAEAAV